MGGNMLFCPPQVLGSVDRDPETVVPERVQPPGGRQLGERRALVVSPLRKALDRLLSEYVHTTADPDRQECCLVEPCHDIAVAELNEPERGRGSGDGDGGARACLSMLCQDS
jgi:hypothetical protein